MLRWDSVMSTDRGKWLWTLVVDRARGEVVTIAHVAP